MKKLLEFVCIGLFLVSLVSAQDLEDASSTLWNGLAAIIERNKHSPNMCVAQVERFIQRNQAAFDAWHRSVQEQIERTKKNPYLKVNPEDLEKAAKAMESSGTVRALNRWVDAITDFSMEYPHHAAQISVLMEPYSTKPHDEEQK
ncbi:MAG: hypothetical protein JSW40_08700 [Candidatus Omnitrophota bacterium]|nr:MAG: hypothetical protein JSW40_08700 [Candidatus Omnitrophota bacterium]